MIVIRADARRIWTRNAGVTVVLVGAIVLLTLQYLMPVRGNYFGLMNPQGARQFALWLLGGVPKTLGVRAYIWGIRAALIAMWVGYGVAMASMSRTRRIPVRGLLLTFGALSAVLAVAFPATLSHDLYAYLAYGRMAALHGWNPYMHTLSELAKLGDPAAAHYDVAAPTVYGPAWTLLSTWIAAGFSAMPQVFSLVAFKVVEGAALVLAAFSARSIARVWDPVHADLAFAAVIMNPLLLLEGPGNGHNDVLMVALMLAGIALVARKSWLGWPVLGLSVGIKFMTLAVVPWLVYRQVRGMRGRVALGRAAAMFALVLAPVALAFVAYWAGPDTLEGLRTVWAAKAASSPSGGSYGPLVCAGLYAALSLWVLLGKKDPTVPAWTIWSLVAARVFLPAYFPWYAAWPASLTFTRWDRGQRLLTMVVTVATLGFALARYSVWRH